MSDDPTIPEPDSPAPIDPDAPAGESADADKTVVRQIPGRGAETPGEETAVRQAAQPTVVHETAAPEPVPPAPSPDPPPAPPRPAGPPASYAKPSAPSPTSWSAPGRDETAAPSADGSGSLTEKLNDRPELAIGGAFAGGLLIALILKRLAR